MREFSTHDQYQTWRLETLIVVANRSKAWKAALSKFSFYFYDHKSEIVWSHERTLTLWLSNSSASVNRNTNFIWLIGGLFKPLLLRINRGRRFLPLKITVEKARKGLVIIDRLVGDRRIFGLRQSLWHFCYFIKVIPLITIEKFRGPPMSSHTYSPFDVYIKCF